MSELEETAGKDNKVRTSSKTGIDWYLQRIKSTPLLTSEQEKQLARRVREHSDITAREQMIAANLRLVIKIAKDYSNRGMTLGDLVAEGNLGLMRAVEEFDPDAGVRFSTYASWWIKQSIKRAIINAGQPVHIPAYLSKLIAKWRNVSRQLEAKFGRPPTIDEMAEALNISRKKADIVQEGLRAVNAPSQMGGEASQSMDEMIADEEGISPDQSMLDESNAPIVSSLLKHLDDRERKIIEMRFGLDGYEGPQRTYKEIGKTIGLTRERVRQIERIALAKLNKMAEDLL